jgi:hypothetical protein
LRNAPRWADKKQAIQQNGKSRSKEEVMTSFKILRSYVSASVGPIGSRGLFAASIALGLASSMLVAPAARAADAGLVLEGVTVVDTHDGKLSPNMRVTITGGKISAISAAGGPAPDASAKTVDAHGKFVVPGYLDMHAHTVHSNDPAGGLKLMLANGITGFRQMSGTSELLAARHDGKLGLSDKTPELLAMPGEILTPLNAGSPEEVIAEVDKQKADGADFIKMINTPPPVFFAAEAEAKRVGLTMSGHLPGGVDAAAASDAGFKAIEHLGPRDAVLLSCSTDEAALREIKQLPPQFPPNVPFEKLMEMVIANPYLMTPAPEFTRYQRVIDTFSEEKCKQLAAKFVANGTWQVPTLIRLRTMSFGADPQYVNNPNLRYEPASTLQVWQSLGQQFAAKMTPQQTATLSAMYDLNLKLVKLFDDAGVKMAAGDDGGSIGIWVVPGFGLHQEFDELAKAGLSPLRVLQMTTLNGAEFFDKTTTMGSVEPGKNADLVLLDANPVESVQNLHKIAGVVRAGNYYSHDDLEKLKAEVLESRKTESPSGGSLLERPHQD